MCAAFRHRSVQSGAGERYGCGRREVGRPSRESAVVATAFVRGDCARARRTVSSRAAGHSTPSHGGGIALLNQSLSMHSPGKSALSLHMGVRGPFHLCTWACSCPDERGEAPIASGNSCLTATGLAGEFRTPKSVDVFRRSPQPRRRLHRLRSARSFRFGLSAPFPGKRKSEQECPR